MQAIEYKGDFYSDAAIENPWPVYAALRGMGPVVYLSRLQNFALTQHSEVQMALRDDETFISSQGVAADQFGCEFLQGNTVASDAERHTLLRKAMAPPLLPGALKEVEQSILDTVRELIDRLLVEGEFDAIADLSRYLPLTIVRELVGLPDFGQERMLKWASAAFNVLGVQNERGVAALDAIAEMREFIATTDSPGILKEGSWTARIQELVKCDHLSAELAPFAIRDYINPSLDTTIAATGELIFQLGKNQQQWQMLRDNPHYLTGAVNEAVRLSTPIRSFSRHTSKDVEVAGVKIPRGSRVMLLFASANRDEKVFANPDCFDITRNTRLHLGFGSGVHMCVGMHLAQLEMKSLLQAMIERVDTIELGMPTRAMNNTISAFATIPCRFTPLQTISLEQTAKKNAVAEITKNAQLEVTVANRRVIADATLLLTLAPQPGKQLVPAEAGAHIDLYLGPDLVRQYSLTGRIQPDQYQIAVKLDKKSRGGSSYVHNSLHIGVNLLIGKPRNHFALQPSSIEGNPSGTVYLFAGGIGLTPLLAMAWELHLNVQPFELHVFSRTGAAIPFGDEFDCLPFAHNITVHLDNDKSTQQKKTLLPGKIANDISGADQLYLCGPAGFMEAVQGEALQAGLTAEHIYTEHFNAEIDSQGDTFTVVAKRSGVSVEVLAHMSILEALESAGVAVPSACQNGVCGSCLLPVLAGKPEHRDLVQTDVEKSQNEFIAACCSRSQTSTLELDI